MRKLYRRSRTLARLCKRVCETEKEKDEPFIVTILIIHRHVGSAAPSGNVILYKSGEVGEGRHVKLFVFINNFRI